MRIEKVIPSRCYVRQSDGRRFSLYGACPWTSDAEKADYVLTTVGWTWLLDNGTIGLGRVPAKTEAEALQVMASINARRVPSLNL